MLVEQEREILLAILDLATTKLERGWCQDAYQKDDHYCLVGAVGEAAREVCHNLATLISGLHGPTLYESAISRVEAELPCPFNRPYAAVEFNDVYLQTQDAVVSVVKKAASRLVPSD